MEKTYEFSEEIIKQRKKMTTVLGIMMLVTMVIISIVLNDIKDIKNIKMFSGIIIGVMIFIIIEMMVVSNIMYKKLRSMKIVISENGLERQGGKFVESILFSDLTKVKVTKEPSGKIAGIKLKTTKKSFIVGGFENMEEMLIDITEKLDNQSLLTIKTWKVNWNSPWICLVSGGITLLVIIVLMKISMNIYETFNSLFFIGFSMFFLIYRPISRKLGKRFKTFETIIGILILVSQIFNVIGKLLG